jgi:hypothetical protein
MKSNKTDHIARAGKRTRGPATGRGSEVLAAAASPARRARHQAGAIDDDDFSSLSRPRSATRHFGETYPLSGLPTGRSCTRCHGGEQWGRSPLCARCLAGARLLVNAEGEPTDPLARQRGELWAARYRYRLLQGSWYVYRVWRVDGRARERYLGAVWSAGDPYELPALRSPPASTTRAAGRS